MKMKMLEVEAEAAKLKEMESASDPMNISGNSLPGVTSPAFLTPEEKKEIDNRSIYVGNVSALCLTCM